LLEHAPDLDQRLGQILLDVTTCVPSVRVPARPCRSSESIAVKNAANVLPDPVGAAISVFLPAWINGQARCCGSVGAGNRDPNQRSTAG